MNTMPRLWQRFNHSAESRADPHTLCCPSERCGSKSLLASQGPSLPAPVGHFVVAGTGKLVLVGAVGQHGPDGGPSAAGALEHDVASVGSPGREVVVAGLMRDLQPALAG